MLTAAATDHDPVDTPDAPLTRMSAISWGARVMVPAPPAPSTAPVQPQYNAGAAQHTTRNTKDRTTVDRRSHGRSCTKMNACRGRARTLPITSGRERTITP